MSPATAEGCIPRDAAGTIEDIGPADVLVGIPAYNNEWTIGRVITAVEAGLRTHFPDLRAVICVSDGGSSDATREVAAAAGVGDDVETLLVPEDSPVPGRIVFPYQGTPGKGSALRAVCETAGLLGVKGCAVVDADLRSITPNWIDRLLSPVIRHGAEYVAPVYSRHKYDGTITNCIAYPLTAALYGTRLRQPIGGEFAFSGQVAKSLAAHDVWDTDVARFGIDIWMTTVALVEGRRTCQTILGAKLHDAKDPGKDLGPMFGQVVGSLFALAAKYHDVWDEVDEIVEPRTYGFRAAFSAEPIKVSIGRLTWKFVDGFLRYQKMWSRVLSDQSLDGVRRAVAEASEHPRGLVLAAELWTRIVYDYLVAWGARTEEPGPLLDSLIPLYFARTATFVQEVADESYEEAERRIHHLADLALELKPYLRDRWREEAVPVRTLREQAVPKSQTPEGAEEALASESA